MRDYINEQMDLVKMSIESAKKALETAKDQHDYLQAKEIFNYNLGKLEALKGMSAELFKAYVEVA